MNVLPLSCYIEICHTYADVISHAKQFQEIPTHVRNRLLCIYTGTLSPVFFKDVRKDDREIYTAMIRRSVRELTDTIFQLILTGRYDNEQEFCLPNTVVEFLKKKKFFDRDYNGTFSEDDLMQLQYHLYTTPYPQTRDTFVTFTKDEMRVVFEKLFLNLADDTKSNEKGFEYYSIFVRVLRNLIITTTEPAYDNTVTVAGTIVKIDNRLATQKSPMTDNYISECNTNIPAIVWACLPFVAFELPDDCRIKGSGSIPVANFIKVLHRALTQRKHRLVDYH